MTMAIDERREAFLHEMGVGPVWRQRDASAAQIPQPDLAVVQVPAEPVAAPAAPVASAAPVAPAVPSVEAAQSEPDGFFEPMPLDAYDPSLFGEDSDDEGAFAASDVDGMSWEQLKERVSNCTKCGLCRGRTNTVFGVGDEKAKWLFIGEGPGRNEDLQGEPFVGPAGKLLDNMLLSMGLKRGANAYIANIVKCRPTDESGKDRPPTPAEAAACLPYLRRQIELIQPTVLVALGKTAAISLLAMNPDTPVAKLRGTVHRYAGKPLIVTYHPAYLLRNLVDKKKAWSDLCLAMATYAGAD